jgi:hypothetical protein
MYYHEEQEGPLFIAKLLKKKPPTVSRGTEELVSNPVWYKELYHV